MAPRYRRGAEALERFELIADQLAFVLTLTAVAVGLSASTAAVLIQLTTGVSK